MKLLFDENLSPTLAPALSDLYPESAHVHECGLGRADDQTVWQYAKDKSFTIVSKDSDFQDRSVVLGAPPKVIWLRVKNCATAEIEILMRAAFDEVRRFITEDSESCMILATRVRER